MKKAKLPKSTITIRYIAQANTSEGTDYEDITYEITPVKNPYGDATLGIFKETGMRNLYNLTWIDTGALVWRYKYKSAAVAIASELYELINWTAFIASLDVESDTPSAMILAQAGRTLREQMPDLRDYVEHPSRLGHTDLAHPLRYDEWVAEKRRRQGLAT